LGKEPFHYVIRLDAFMATLSGCAAFCADYDHTPAEGQELMIRRS